MKEGENAIGGILADGWYSGFVGFGNRRDHYGKYPRLSAQLFIEYADGMKSEIKTGRTWKASTEPVIYGDFLDGESYDARKEMPGWDKPGFNDASWKKVSLTRKVKAFVESYPSVTVKVFKERKPLSVKEPEKGNFVFDMGTSIYFPRFSICQHQGLSRNS